MTHDTDDFNRWDQSRKIYLDCLYQMIQTYQKKKTLNVPEEMIVTLQTILKTKVAKKTLLTKLLGMYANFFGFSLWSRNFF